MNEIETLIRQLLEDRSWKALKKELNNIEHYQIADLIEILPKQEQIVLFRLLSRDYAKEVFEHLSHDTQEDISEGMAGYASKLTELLNDLDPDDRTAFFEELPGEVSQRLLQMLSAEERQIATQLLGYPKDTIGRLMTTEYVAIKPYFTVQQALEHIRKFGHDSDNRAFDDHRICGN